MKHIDLTGQKFGRLTVIERNGDDGYKHPKWMCLCECGNKVSVAGNSLIKGTSKSCRCLANELSSKRYRANLSGRKFGRLTAIKATHKDKHHHWTWMCKCECGEIIYKDVCSLTSGKVISCGCLKRERFLGKNNPKWNGGINPENNKIRNSRKIKDWRTSIFERDSWKCQHCGKVGGELNVHHILAFAKYPKQRANIDNGITLCKKCHDALHRKNRKYA